MTCIIHDIRTKVTGNMGAIKVIQLFIAFISTRIRGFHV